MTGEGIPAYTTEITIPSSLGITALPGWLCRHAALQSLNMFYCKKLASLPAELASLASLQTLNLRFCKKLASLPAELASLASLRTLNLSCCGELTSLPAELASLASLRNLNLHDCSALTRMPDLSELAQLQVERLPDHLKAWEAGGRKAGTFEPAHPPAPELRRLQRG
jgi:hypothetical protein